MTKSGSARSDAASVVKYCVATEAYRRRHAGGFARAVGRMDDDTLVHLLYGANQLAVFEQEIGRLGIAGHLLPRVHAYAEYQRFYNGQLLAILDGLPPLLGRVRPILLKGPAFWGDLYAEPSLRPVRDLDLLCTTYDDCEALCAALRAAGFTETPSDRSIAHYEYAQFRRTREVTVDDETAAHLAFVCREVAPRRIRPVTKRRFRVFVPVEVHESLFLYTDATTPRVRPEDLGTWSLDRRWSVLSRAANLPYLSLKFVLDAERHIGRALKLLGDLVRIVARATQEEMARSIEIAREWTLTGAYAHALRHVAALTPEIELRGLQTSRRANAIPQLVTDILAGS